MMHIWLNCKHIPHCQNKSSARSQLFVVKPKRIQAKICRITPSDSPESLTHKPEAMADKDKAKIDLGLLEEDDEFEEFPAEGRK